MTTTAYPPLSASSSGPSQSRGRTNVLHERVSANTLAIARICVFGTWLLHVLFDRIPEMADMPLDLMEPAGVLRLIPEAAWPWIWTSAALWALKMLLLIGL